MRMELEEKKKNVSSKQKSHTKKQIHLYQKKKKKNPTTKSLTNSSIALDFQPLHGKAKPHCIL